MAAATSASPVGIGHAPVPAAASSLPAASPGTKLSDAWRLAGGSAGEAAGEAGAAAAALSLIVLLEGAGEGAGAGADLEGDHEMLKRILFPPFACPF